MIAGMTRSMASVNNMYVGYFRINDHASWDEPVTKANERVAIRDMAVQPDRVALYDQMHALNASGGTPNRQAVMAAGEQFRRTDDDGPVRLACQRNAMMLFTDGFSNNGGPTLPNPQNRDGGMGVPFSDSHSNTMADIAASFYLNDSNGNSPISRTFRRGWSRFRAPVQAATRRSIARTTCTSTSTESRLVGVATFTIRTTSWTPTRPRRSTRTGPAGRTTTAARSTTSGMRR